MAFGCVLIQEAFQSAGTVPSLVTHRAPAENSSGYRRICWGHDQGDSDLRGLDEPTHVQSDLSRTVDALLCSPVLGCCAELLGAPPCCGLHGGPRRQYILIKSCTGLRVRRWGLSLGLGELGCWACTSVPGPQGVSSSPQSPLLGSVGSCSPCGRGLWFCGPSHRE